MDDEHEEEVTLEQCPAAVRATILREAGDGKITEIERETDKNGKVTYEAEFMLDGQEIEIEIAPDGTLLGREVEDEGDDDDDLSLGDIPEAARRTLLRLAGDAKIIEVEREREHGVVVYEATWRKNGTTHEAEVTAGGALLETEQTVRGEQVPAAVRAAIVKRFGDRKVHIEKITIVMYEAEAKIDGRTVEIVISPAGHVRDHGGDEGEGDGHDDDDDDDDDDD